MSRRSTGTVDFRGNPPRWWARVTATDATGEKHRPWVDLERPDIPNTPEGKALAKKLALSRAKLAAKKSYVGVEQAASSKATLLDLEERWHALLDRDPDLKVKTVGRYKSSWNQIVAEFGQLPVAQITPPRIQDWIWRRRGERGTSTVLNDCNALSRFFQDAIRQKWIPGPNPMVDPTVTDAKPKQEHPKPEDISRWPLEQVERLLAVEGMPDDLFGLLLTDLTTGARSGEGRGLQFRHLKDRDGRACVNIVQQAVHPDDGQVLLGPPKWGSKRKNPLHSQLAPWLAWWRETGWRKHVGRRPTDDDFVFPDASGKMCRPRDADTLREWCTKAGVPTHFVCEDGERVPFDMNSVRHTFASLLGELEVDGEVLDALMGHTPKSVRARHYMDMPFERKVRAVERLRLRLPDRPGVDSSRESSPEPERSSDDGGGVTLQATGTTDSLPDRRRMTRWRGPRSSKPV